MGGTAQCRRYGESQQQDDQQGAKKCWIEASVYLYDADFRIRAVDRVAGAISSSLQQFLSAFCHRTVGELGVGGG